MVQLFGAGHGIVENIEDLIEKDPQLKHRHFYHMLSHPELGEYIAPTHPFQLSKTLCELRRAPLLGEHNEYVFKEILQMSEDEIADLIMDGVIE